MIDNVSKTEPEREKLLAAKRMVSILLTAVKSYSLYSPGHPSCEQAVLRFHDHLVSFLNTFGPLTLDVQRGQLLVEGVEAHSGPANEDNLAFVLFRDGIQWLKFLEGVETWETTLLIGLCVQYRKIPPEPDGDLVTTLWEAQLPHLDYKATEYVPESDAQPDAPADGHIRGGQLHSSESRHVQPSEAERPSLGVLNSLTPDPGAEEIIRVDLDSIQLTPQEAQKLREMVAQEENLDPTEEVLHVLFDIIRNQVDSEFLVLILDFLKAEFETALVEAQFDFNVKILQGFHQIHQWCQDERPSELKELEAFFASVSSPETLGILRAQWSDESGSDLKKIEQMLLLMPPGAILALLPMLRDASTPHGRKMLTRVIFSLTAADLTPLEALAKSQDEDLLPVLIGIVEKIDGDRATQILLGMTRHPSERVRRLVLKALVNREPWVPEAVFFLLDDASEPVRQAALSYLASRRSEVAENLLVNYLKNGNGPRKDKEHIFSCFRALGRCGSDRSISFLRRNLLEGSPLSKFMRSTERQAAALALRALHTEEARRLLEKAARSLFPGVRRAVRMALENGVNP